MRIGDCLKQIIRSLSPFRVRPFDDEIQESLPQSRLMAATRVPSHSRGDRDGIARMIVAHGVENQCDFDASLIVALEGISPFIGNVYLSASIQRLPKCTIQQRGLHKDAMATLKLTELCCNNVDSKV